MGGLNNACLLKLNASLEKNIQFSSVAQSCQLFVTPWTAVHQASLSITNSWSLLKLMSIESGIPSNHLILCRPLLLLPWIFPSIRVFSKESILYITCPKYWSFSFSTSPSNEYSLTSHNWMKNTTASCFMTSMHMLSHVMILTQSDLMQYKIDNLT